MISLGVFESLLRIRVYGSNAASVLKPKFRKWKFVFLPLYHGHCDMTYDVHLPTNSYSKWQAQEMLRTDNLKR